ncbi:caspase-8-like [Penaeus japonicus]|uniref:caspase-8-like n=1 Tax=Penaeus japonicus TaxID=27405 RepID=UPI001C71113D|nr:caspase-8-like [Penaeus japonicus]
MDPVQRQLSNLSLSDDQEFLCNLRDEDVAKILFLSIDSNKMTMESDALSEYQSAEGIFANTEASTSSRLLEKFKRSLAEKRITPLRRELKLRLVSLSCVQLVTNSLNTLESNFSDENKELSDGEEDILRFTELLEMFNLPVPKNIRDNFESIISTKKIPLSMDPDKSRRSTFFVEAENKIMVEIGDTLSPSDVFHLYRILSTTVEGDEKVNELLSQEVDQDSLEKVPGLKEVAFYHLILEMLKKQMINRLYTHKLYFLFNQLKEMKFGEAAVDPHIDRILNTLSQYPIASSPPGLCLVFLMTEDRPGASYDLAKVRELFEKEYKFAFFVKKDPTAEEIKSIICKLKAARYKFYDSLVVWFMGHGDKTYLTVKEGHIHRRLDLIQPFTEIEWYNKKPKLFFIQACGTKKNRRRFSSTSQIKAVRTSTDSLSIGWRASAGSEWQDKYADYTDMSVVNSFADTLISYATIWYQYASRGDKGSLYIDTLVDQLRQNGYKESVENVLQRVHYNVNTVSLLHSDEGQDIVWKQAPFFESSLQKVFIFPKPEEHRKKDEGS